MTEQECLKSLCRIQCGAKQNKKCEDCECFDDKVNIWKCVENTQESLVLRKLIREHFELVELLKPHGYGMLSAEEFEHWISYICKHNADNDMIIMSQNEQLESIKNPQPYKFEDLKVGMWIWDDENEMFILITFIDKQFKKMHFCLTEYDGFNDEYVNVEYTEYFEEGRFFPVTKTMEYQNKGNKVNESKDNIK